MLKARDDHVAHVLDDAKKQLSKIAHDRSKYPAIIEKLIAQVGWNKFSCIQDTFRNLLWKILNIRIILNASVVSTQTYVTMCITCRVCVNWSNHPLRSDAVRRTRPSWRARFSLHSAPLRTRSRCMLRLRLIARPFCLQNGKGKWLRTWNNWYWG